MSFLPGWSVARHRHRASHRLRPAGVLLVATAIAAGALVLGIRHVPQALWLMPSNPVSATKAAHDAAVSGRPTWLRIPRISVNTPLEELGLDAQGALNPPSNFQEAGWYAGGTRPGDVGPAVIAGHVDSQHGPAIFYRLRELHAGDLVQVERGGHWLTFTVVATGRYAKTAFPTAEVYGPTPDPQLRLITCGGPFDRADKSYLDDVVIYAVVAS